MAEGDESPGLARCRLVRGVRVASRQGLGLVAIHCLVRVVDDVVEIVTGPEYDPNKTKIIQ